MLPNFLILGAPRSGTTTVYESLKQHPQIYLSPVKEPMFFILEGEKVHFPGPISPAGPRDLEEYRSLFRNVRKEKAVGEASVYYLYHPAAPERIRKYIPDAKFIVLLRNPADRAYSQFLHNRVMGIEPIADFERALAAEEDRIRQGWFVFWCYREVGFYSRQIQRYVSLFESRQFRFFLMEDLSGDPGKLFSDIFEFLDIDASIPVRLPRKYNPSGGPRDAALHAWLMKPNAVKSLLKKVIPPKIQYNLLTDVMSRNLDKPRLAQDLRKRLTAIYREDILRTQDLIRRDLSAWLAES
jgi:hypothetical protein